MGLFINHFKAQVTMTWKLLGMWRGQGRIVHKKLELFNRSE